MQKEHHLWVKMVFKIFYLIFLNLFISLVLILPAQLPNQISCVRYCTRVIPSMPRQDAQQIACYFPFTGDSTSNFILILRVTLFWSCWYALRSNSWLYLNIIQNWGTLLARTPMQGTFHGQSWVTYVHLIPIICDCINRGCAQVTLTKNRACK